MCFLFCYFMFFYPVPPANNRHRAWIRVEVTIIFFLYTFEWCFSKCPRSEEKSVLNGANIGEKSIPNRWKSRENLGLGGLGLPWEGTWGHRGPRGRESLVKVSFSPRSLFDFWMVFEGPKMVKNHVFLEFRFLDKKTWFFENRVLA